MIVTSKGMPLTRGAEREIIDELAEGIKSHIDSAKEAGLAQGQIVAVLHAFAHQETYVIAMAEDE